METQTAEKLRVPAHLYPGLSQLKVTRQIPAIKPMKTTLRYEVCKAFNILEEVLFTRSRKREICNARQVYVYLVMTVVPERNAGDMSMSELMEAEARKSPSAMAKHIREMSGHASWSHATIIYSRDKAVPNFIATEPSIRNLVVRLSRELACGNVVMPRILVSKKESNENN